MTLTEALFSFACSEKPERCFLSCPAHNKRIGSMPHGDVFVTNNRENFERWNIVPSKDENIVYLKNVTHSHFLKSNNEGHLSTNENNENEETKWCIQRHSKDMFMISSVIYDRLLSCNDKDAYTASRGQKESWSHWNIEFETGELCFISSFCKNRRLSCDVSGKLSLSENWLGWEVWRFMEVGDGTVLISSWTHDSRFLWSNPNGNVYTTENRFGSWERWSIEKLCKKGIVIKSCIHGTFLTMNDHGLCTSESYSDDSLWCIEPGCAQIYFISSHYHDKRIGTSADSPFVTKNWKGWEQWKITKSNTEGYFIIVSQVHKVYLSSSKCGNIYVQHEAGVDSLWKIRNSPYGGYFIISKANKKCLSSDGRGMYVDSDERGWQSWRLEPYMPKTISGKEIIGATCATALALTTMISLPFAAMGVVGALGFAEGGIAAGSFAASMMSAEAIASGGGVAIGGTVATLQSIGVLGLGLGGTSAAVGTGALIGGAVGGAIMGACKSGRDCVQTSAIAHNMHRPFCDWRTW